MKIEIKIKDKFIILGLILSVLIVIGYQINPVDDIKTYSEKNISKPHILPETPLTSWNFTWGGGQDDRGFDIAVDSSNNIYVIGETDSFGAGNYDLLLLKYNSSGVEQWNRTWGGGNNDNGYGIAIDSNDDIYVVGQTSSFGAKGEDICLLKYNSTGDKQWNTTWGGSITDKGYGVATDSNDDIYVTGWTNSFGAVGYDIFIAKYNKFGAKQWNYTWGGNGVDYGKRIAVDSSDNFYIVGDTESFEALDKDIFIAKYNSLGIKQWNKTLGLAEEDKGYGVGIDKFGKIYFVGGIENETSFEHDMFFAKYDSSGIEEWNRTWGGSNEDYAKGITFDSSNNIYIAGDINGISMVDQCLVKFNSSGEEEWFKVWEGDKNDYCTGIANDSLDNIYITGWANSFTAGGMDVFMAKYDDIYPSVMIESYDTQAEYSTGSINVQINVTDEDIKTPVQIRFYEPDSSVIGTYDMDNPSGNDWNYTWNVGSYTPANNYYFRILAKDGSDNLNDTVMGYFNLVDTVKPMVEVLSYNTETVSVIGTINIQANITDNHQVKSPVQVRFYEPDYSIIGTYGMINSVGSLWIYTWNVGSYGPANNYSFRVIAYDASDNLNNTIISSFNITSLTPPPTGDNGDDGDDGGDDAPTDFTPFLIIIGIIVVSGIGITLAAIYVTKHRPIRRPKRKREVKEIELEPDVFHCPFCHAKLPLGAEFCSYCNTSLKSEEES